MKKKALILLTAVSVFLGGCGKIGKNTDTASEEFFAMDTIMTVTCYGEKSKEAVQDSVSEVKRLDGLLSVGNPESEISGINNTGSGTVSEDTSYLIGRSLEIYRSSGGVFDISVYPLMELWGFTTGEFRVPSQEEIDETLKYVDSSEIEFDAGSGKVKLSEGQGIDLGGIAKGYASTGLMEVFREHELSSGLVSLGGNVQCFGTKTDGSMWRCGIKDPHDPNNTEKFLGIVEISDKAVITSGAYERYFTDEKTGKTYHHIINPRTGYPADSGIISATIVSADGTLADALSTACYIMGVDKAAEYWRNSGEEFDMILMTEDDVVYITEPLKNSFKSDYRTEIISK